MASVSHSRACLDSRLIWAGDQASVIRVSVLLISPIDSICGPIIVYCVSTLAVECNRRNNHSFQDGQNQHNPLRSWDCHNNVKLGFKCSSIAHK